MSYDRCYLCILCFDMAQFRLHHIAVSPNKIILQNIILNCRQNFVISHLKGWNLSSLYHIRVNFVTFSWMENIDKMSVFWSELCLITEWRIIISPRVLIDVILLFYTRQCIDGLVREWGNSNALAMELLQSCTKPLIQCYELQQPFGNIGRLLQPVFRNIHMIPAG